MRDAKKTLPVDPNIAVATLEDALALWRGPALADLADQPSLLAEAARLDELRLEAQEARIEGLLAAGAQARAIGELEALLARHPWRESLWGLLMLAFYREGRQAEALRSYQRAREILADELGIDPSPELLRLHERVLQQDPGLDLRGEPLRGYRLLEKIDDGPTGVVFRAIQPHVERDVAVKIFHEGIAADPEFVRRFDPDAQAVAALEHPHIAPIYDYWREPGRAYIVSRYLRGGSLRAIEERGEPLERDRVLRVVEQISLALAFAHRQGVAHGNVGSSNILFDPEGNAYLGDFLIRGGPAPDPSEDVRELARLAKRLLPNEALLRGARRERRARDRCTGGGCVRRWRPARPSNPRRSPLLDALRSGTPTRASGRSPRPTPATSSGGGSSFGASSPGSRRRGPDPGSWPSSARAGAGSLPWSARDWFRRSGTGPWEARRIRSSPRCSPERTPSTSSRPRCFGSRCVRCPACTTGSIQDLGDCSRRSISLRPARRRSCSSSISSRRSSRSPQTSGSGSCSWSRFASPPPTPRAGSASS